MATISVSLPSDGSTADVSDYNTPITTIVNEINGNLDNSNIDASAAIATSKLADDAGITTAKIADGSVTDSKWRNGVAFSAYRSSALNVGAANVDIVFNTENYDYGSDYDNSTGVFTAPYDGIYSFVVTMDGTAASTARMFIQPVTTGTTTIINQRPLDINATRTYLVQAVFEGRMDQNATIKFQGFSVSTVNVAGTMTNVSGHLVTRV